MFVKINKTRIKLTTIKEYTPCNKPTSDNKWYLEIKYGTINRIFYFDTFEQLNKCMYNLDKLLKVTLVD